MSHLPYGYPLNFLLFSFFLCSFVFAQHFLLSRPINLGDNFSNLRLSDVVHIIAVSDDRLLIFPGVRIDGLMYFESFYILSHLEFISTGSVMMFLPFSNCFSRQDFSFNALDFPKSNPSFVHLKAGLLSLLSEDIILIAFEVSSSNLNNQYDQLSLKGIFSTKSTRIKYF
ncbi:hypothetical protein RCL1_006357 [Eukaryota sp. TZLM3-RCL]